MLGQRHFDVQVMGGAALHLGWVAEMKTGEGKTLVATLPSYLNALAGRGVHVVTVNDYLAKRDAEWMGRIHRFLGLTVGTIIPDDSTPDEKRAQYDCDIIYGTNNEFGFDYLRDNMVVERRRTSACAVTASSRWSPHYFAIVDEVDSILIDEARTPLIISGRAADAAELYYQFARSLAVCNATATTKSTKRSAPSCPTEDGIARVEEALGVENLYENVHQNYVHQLQQALRGKELFKRDVDYIVSDGEVKIVDEFTGRILEGRRWSEGLHQAVEAKEGVKIKEENQTLATVTLQNYFRMYDKLGGHDRYRVDRGRRVRAHVRPAGRVDPDEPRHGPRRRRRLHLQDRRSEVRGRGRRHRRTPRQRPARPRRHDLGREVGEAVARARRSTASSTRC